MGAPGILRLSDDRGHSATYYLHWASPQYQFGHLGELVHQLRRQGTPLTVASYEAYAATLPAGLIPTERMSSPFPSTDYQYDMHLGERVVTLSVIGECCPTYSGSEADLYQDAARLRRELAIASRRLADRNGGHPVSYAPDPEDCEADASAFDMWAAHAAGVQGWATDHDRRMWPMVFGHAEARQIPADQVRATLEAARRDMAPATATHQDPTGWWHTAPALPCSPQGAIPTTGVR
jgi:hypothetical protein